MKKINKKVVLSTILVVVILVGSFALFQNRKTIYINAVLTTKAYDYLPNEAKDFVKETYKKTGNVILTEKNKEDNELYLNPMYIEYLTSTAKEQEEAEIIPQALVVDYIKRDISGDGDDEELPYSYNIENYITPTRNQGSLGICWSYATAEAAESYILKTTNTTYEEAISPPNISVRQMDYATATDSLVDYRSEYTTVGLRKLGGGGNFNIASLALANGISGVNTTSFNDDTGFQRKEVREVLNYYYAKQELNFTTNMPRLNLRESTDGLSPEEYETREQYLNTIKEKIMTTGAAYISTYMNQKCFVPSDEYSDHKIIDVYNCETKNQHAMQIIGWDDDYQYEYCADSKQHTTLTDNCIRVVKGRGVWKVRNSWGEENYEYPYVAYDSLYSDISTIDNMETKVGNKWNWDSNYTMGTGTEGLTRKVYRLEELERLKAEEKLKKVKFFVSAPGNYSIKVKKSNGSEITYTENASEPGLVTYTYSSDVRINSTSQITITAPGFIDSLSIFTSNLTTNPTIDVSEYDNIEISDSSFRFYSETKNIDSNSYLTYKVYDSNNVDKSYSISITNNIVAQNNVNTLFSNLDNLDAGTYRVDILYNNITLIGRFNMIIKKMAGSGTPADPYVITTPEQLAQIKNDLDASYVLGNDIDLTEATGPGGRLSKTSSLCPQGFGWEAISGFSGVLDGQGYTIKGLRQDNYLTCNEENGTLVKESNDSGNGLFYKVRGNASIRNLNLEDVDMNCQNEYCGVLVSEYVANFNSSGTVNYSDTTAYEALFKNIAIKNSRIYRKPDIGNSYVQGSGLFGVIQNTYGPVEVSNIYIDLDVNEDMSEKAYLVHYIQGRPATVKNIYVQGTYNPSSDNLSIIYEAMAQSSSSIVIRNILSTITKESLPGTVVNYMRGNNYTIDGINMINASNKPVCGNITCTTTNVNIVDVANQATELTKPSNYNTWTAFYAGWNYRIGENINRYPRLINVTRPDTVIPEITIDHELNQTYNVYDYVTPAKESKDRLKFSSKNPSILTVDTDGTITPKSYGSAYLHVESLFDGYVKDVLVNVNYQRHFIVKFMPNGGTGTMDDIEVPIGEYLTLPECGFTKQGYSIKSWNTKADGTGKTYSNLGQVMSYTDQEVITLYAQWSGEQYEVTFDANGGTVNPRTKIVRTGEAYGELPIPTREGYGFIEWYTDGYGRITSNSILNSTQVIADWRENAFTIIYDGNSGALETDFEDLERYNNMNNSTIISTGSYEYPPSLDHCHFVKKGYTFKEWNTKANGTGTSYEVGDELSLSSVNNGTARLYAIWEKDAKYVILSREQLYMTRNQVVTVSAFIDPAVSNQYTLNDIEWYSNNDDVAAVDNGLIRAYNPGETTITAYLPIGLETTIHVVVSNSARPIVKGDIDYSNEVDATDIILTLKKIFRYLPEDEEDLKYVDINNNRVIDTDDLIRMLKYLFKYIDSL